MYRRDFVRNLAASAAGILVLPDALELLVEPRRKLWPGHNFATTATQQVEAYDAFICTMHDLSVMIREEFVASGIENLINRETTKLYTDARCPPGKVYIWDSESPPVWNPV